MKQRVRWLSTLTAVAVYTVSSSAQAQPAEPAQSGPEPAEAAPAEAAPAPAAPAETAPAETAPPSPAPTASDNGWDEAGPEQPAATAPVMAPVSSDGPTDDELERKKTLQRKKGIMIGGWTTLGVTYGTALTVGVIAIDTAEGNSSRRTWGRRMTIPIGGPIAAAFVSKTASGTLFTVLTGAAQATGLVLGVVGTVLYTSERSRQRQLAFSLLPNRNGGMNVGASWRF